MNNRIIYLLIAVGGITATVLNTCNTAMANAYDVIYANLAYYIVTAFASLFTYLYLTGEEHKKNILKIGGPLNLLGGPLGAFVPIFVALGFQHLGAFVTTMSIIAGQFLTSVVIDSKGSFGLPKLKMNKVKWLSVILILIGTIIISI